MNKRGFSLLEAMIAIFVVTAGMMVLASVFGIGLRHATQTRDRALAIVLAENLIEHVRSQPYGVSERPVEWGRDKPNEWSVHEMMVIVEGRKVETKFEHCIEVAEKERGGNGSFFGEGEDFTDVLKIQVRWREGTGVGSKGEDKLLIIYTTVWREYGISTH
jgi:hypothetical protein